MLPAFVAGFLLVVFALQMSLPASTKLPALSSLAPKRFTSAPLPEIPARSAITKKPFFAGINKGANETGTAAALGGTLDATSLVGIAGTGTMRFGIVKTASLPARSVYRGDTVEDWRVAGIQSDRMILLRGREVRELKVGAPPRVQQVSIPAEDAQEEASE